MSFMDKLANVLGNVATRINNLRYIIEISQYTHQKPYISRFLAFLFLQKY